MLTKLLCDGFVFIAVSNIAFFIAFGMYLYKQVMAIELTYMARINDVQEEFNKLLSEASLY